MKYFANRQEAGKLLAMKLKEYANRDDTVVLALPRGGVVVGAEISSFLALPLEIVNVKKIGVPGHKELAMGAIAEREIVYLNNEIINSLEISEKELQRIINAERPELKKREDLYRKKRERITLNNKILIITDDGLATGATMKAALAAVRLSRPQKIIIAVPVAEASVLEKFKELADKVICLIQPAPFWGVGQWYLDFSQTTDQEVLNLLNSSQKQKILNKR